MKPQFTNQVMASTLLWMDHKICKHGEAYLNRTGYFYATDSLYNNYYTYACPFSQLVADSSLSGANVMTGVYLDGSFLGTGQSGFFNINYEKGHVYFSVPITNSHTRLSGNFCVKEIDFKLTTDPDQTILFEKKHFYKQKTTESLTGLANDEITYPAIYLRSNSERNEAWQFGGTDSTEIDIRVIILAESQFQLDAVRSILRDQRYNYVPLLNETEFPYNNFGGLKSGVYNYTGLVNGKIASDNAAYIKEVFIAPFNQRILSQLDVTNGETFIGFADMTLCKARTPLN